eukprot:CAMPEP_0184664286 /NCGR_PEP_ID=MMETSP0308-20130426/52044_1 /TAXON_ID=38269 /ORGANISM="Gloeochaete witrockiana, Strain SAG 46.84" /LENGTH=124 /DNA_ID=CAMNT_0027107565 /DNA_START=60 /DNA_END=431 /DNA_ORIENTATION=+
MSLLRFGRALASSSLQKSLFAKSAASGFSVSASRFYSDDHHGLSRDETLSRVLGVLRSFEKVDANKLSENAHFVNDLGLDSLDAVEVVMAIEDEFAVEIPDEAADKILSVGEALTYILTSPHAK